MAALMLLACALAPAARAVDFGSGELEWGVKQSFREYIEGPIAQGSYEAIAPATENPDGTISFPVYAGSYDSGAGEIAAEGAVRFNGHHGQLDLTITNPVLVIGADDTTLRAHVLSKPFSGSGPAFCDEVDVAAVSPTVGPAEITDPAPGLEFGPWPATLTAAAEPAFALYPAGTDLDPVSVTALIGTPGEPGTDTPSCSPEEPTDPGETPGEEPPVPLPTPQATPPLVQAQNPAGKPKRCRKGFRKVKVKGKQRCVKKKQGKNAKRKAAKRRAAKRA